MSALSATYMHDEPAAFAHIEAMLWPHGPVCPGCGVVGNAYELNGVRSKPSKKNVPRARNVMVSRSAGTVESNLLSASARSSKTAILTCICGYKRST